MKDPHNLLARQLRRIAVDLADLDEPTRKLLETVDSAYKDFDDDRRMLERSLDLSSQELIEANAELRSLLAARKEAERQMEQLHAQRLEAASLLAGGVAHDFNNLLAVITSSCAALMKMTAPADPRAELVGQVEAAAKRAVALTRQLLAFSRRQVLKARVIDLNQTIAHLEPILRPLIGNDIELRSTVEPNLPLLKADPTQIEQVVLNLAVNARDAMPRGGRLAIETSRAPVAETQASAEGRFVRLTVRDTGSGMPPEVRAHIFEPFFTTKSQGTGLGLSTVYGIVRQSGGFVVVDSQVGAGTTFRVYLPEWSEDGAAVNARTAT
jgi:signal transduction histidine kinase